MFEVSLILSSLNSGAPSIKIFAKVRGVEWAEPETEVSTSKGRVLCVKNVPTSFPYSRLVDLFNELSEGQVRIKTLLLFNSELY